LVKLGSVQSHSAPLISELLLKTLDHYCEYRKTPNGIVLTPTQLGKWLIMFCDEINLPDMDKYGTQVGVVSLSF
jgi:dynein heavy chain 1, cytosolic